MLQDKERLYGLHPYVSHEDYHSMTEYISSTYLVALDTVPALAKVGEGEIEGQAVEKEESYVFTFGRAFHTLLLEGEEVFNREFVFEPQIDKRTKEGKADMLVWLAQNSHKTPLRIDSEAHLYGMASSVINHPFACRLMNEGRSEMSIFWQDEKTKLDCKCRPDRIPDGDHGVMVSLKSVKDASLKAFQRDIVNFCYDIREAMYCEGFNAVCSTKIDATVFIVCEKKPPYRVECYTIEDAWLEHGKDEFHRLLALEKKCREEGRWQHYKNEGVTEIEMPKWFGRE